MSLAAKFDFSWMMQLDWHRLKSHEYCGESFLQSCLAEEGYSQKLILNEHAAHFWVPLRYREMGIDQEWDRLLALEACLYR